MFVDDTRGAYIDLIKFEENEKLYVKLITSIQIRGKIQFEIQNEEIDGRSSFFVVVVRICNID